MADGLGGAAAGEVASSLAVEEVLARLSKRDVTIDPALAAEEAIHAANQAIFSRSQHNIKLSGMGTTLVALLAEDRHVCVINVGDSRCYRLRGNQFEQLTLDHSLVEEQVRLGKMTAAEALRSPLRNVITRALGTQVSVTPDIFALEAEPGDLFLLCTDGLTRELSDKQIESQLGVDQPLDQICAHLVSAAKKAGGNDNITSLLVRAI